MDFVSIQSASNPLTKRIRSLHTLKGRKTTGLYLAEGKSVVQDAYKSGALIKELIVSTSYADRSQIEDQFQNIEKVYVLDDKIFSANSTTDNPKGILAIVEKRNHQLDDVLNHENGLFTLACDITDPGNLGTMFRSSLAFGAQGVFLTRGCVDPHNPKVVRSAAGSLFKLPFIEDLQIDQFIDKAKSKGFQVLPMVMDAENSIVDIDFKKPTILVLGNEAHGIPEQVITNSTKGIKIPMANDCESLNVAIAHSIALWEAKKQRGSC